MAAVWCAELDLEQRRIRSHRVWAQHQHVAIGWHNVLGHGDRPNRAMLAVAAADALPIDRRPRRHRPPFVSYDVGAVGGADLEDLEVLSIPTVHILDDLGGLAVDEVLGVLRIRPGPWANVARAARLPLQPGQTACEHARRERAQRLDGACVDLTPCNGVHDQARASPLSQLRIAAAIGRWRTRRVRWRAGWARRHRGWRPCRCVSGGLPPARAASALAAAAGGRFDA